VSAPEPLSTEQRIGIERYLINIGGPSETFAGHAVAALLAEVDRLRAITEAAKADDERVRSIVRDAGVSDHEGGGGDTYYERPTWHMAEELAAWKASAAERADVEFERAERTVSVLRRFRDRARAQRAAANAADPVRLPEPEPEFTDTAPCGRCGHFYRVHSNAGCAAMPDGTDDMCPCGGFTPTMLPAPARPERIRFVGQFDGWRRRRDRPRRLDGPGRAVGDGEPQQQPAHGGS
jgi:hypothetical protein